MAIKPIIYDFPSEFRTENTSALVSAFDDEISALASCFSGLLTGRTLEDAEGATLDLIGSIVGLTREEAAVITEGLIQNYPIDDSDYRKLLKMWIIKLNSICDRAALVAAVKIWDEDDDVTVSSTASVTISGDYNREMLPIAGGIKLVSGGLSAPEISLSGSMLSIVDTSGVAESFDIYVNGSNEETITTWTYDLLNLELAAGVYAIAVKANATGYAESGFSNTVPFYATERLATPQPVLTGTVLSWDAISHADGYQVTASYTDSGQTFSYSETITTTLIDLYDWLIQEAPLETIFTVHVVALGSGSYRNSYPSSAITFLLSNAIEAPTLDIIDGKARAITTDLRTEEIAFYLDGTVQISVVPVE